jgi:4-diphosphocytidyl-2-C-methyl-D-erythritol kinase
MSPGELRCVEVAAPAKLNLALLVGPRRRDGYHEIFSLMIPVSLADLLTAEVLAEGGLRVECVVCDGEQNLAARAAREVERRLGLSFNVRLHIEKRTPPAAGLGGGSSDATAALIALERLYDLRLPRLERYAIAAAVGSDVPFFLWPGPQLSMGRGTVLKAVMLPEPLDFVVAVPDIELPTAEVYAWRDQDLVVGLRDFAARTQRLVAAVSAARSPADLAPIIVNDLEPHVVARRPEIGALKQALLDSGALAAAMTGSGAAVFGLFASVESAEAARSRLIAGSGLPPARVFTVSDLQPTEPAEGLGGGPERAPSGVGESGPVRVRPPRRPSPRRSRAKQPRRATRRPHGSG